jgi:hypothetical protein
MGDPGDGMVPQHITCAAQLPGVAGLTAQADQARKHENMVLGGLLLGRGATLFGKPVVWDLHWPEGAPPGMDADTLRDMGARMVASAGGDPAPGPVRPVADMLDQAMGLVRFALNLRDFGGFPPPGLDIGPPRDPAVEADAWQAWERRARALLRAQEILADQARGKATGEGVTGE